MAERLDAVAIRQGGFFTSSQALAVGYADSIHGYHVRNGDWEKVQRGIYRLSAHPLPSWPELITWSLWSRGRDDRPVGVYCGETAQMIHGILPRAEGVYCMAVPTVFRKGTAIPPEIRLIKVNLPDSDVEQRGGFMVTTLDRTLRDMDVEGQVHCRVSQPDDRNPERTKPFPAPPPPAAAELPVPSAQVPVPSAQLPVPMWSPSMTFDEAIRAGED